MGITATAARRKGLEAFRSPADTAPQAFPKGKTVNGEMDIFWWLRQHLDVLLLGAVIIAIVWLGSRVFGLMPETDSETPKRSRKREDDEDDPWG